MSSLDPASSLGRRPGVRFEATRGPAGPPGDPRLLLAGVTPGEAVTVDENGDAASLPVASAAQSETGQHPAILAAEAGRFANVDPDCLSATIFGVVGDLRTTSTGAMSSVSQPTRLYVYGAVGVFVADDVGKEVKVEDAGLAGADLFSTIVSIAGDGTYAVLADPCLTTVANKPTAWGTDNYDALVAWDAALSADHSRWRRGSLPKGMIGYRGTLLKGKRGEWQGQGWGNVPAAAAGLFYNTAVDHNTVLYQLWDSNANGLQITKQVETSIGYVGPCKLSGFVLQSDASNTVGHGFTTYDETDELATTEDGFFTDEVSVAGFPESGWKVSAGVPWIPMRLHAFGNGGPGFDLHLTDNNWVTDLFAPSGDQNGWAMTGAETGGCLIKVTGRADGTTRGVLKIDAGKAEALPPTYKIPGSTTSAQTRFLWAVDCGGLLIRISSCMHAVGGGSTVAPSEMVRITGTYGPVVEWSQCSIRVNVDQVGGNPVMINDVTNSATVPRTTTSGTYYHGTFAALSSGTAPGGIGHAGTGRRFVVGGDGNYVEGSTELESDAIQVKGTRPGFSLYEVGGPTNAKRHIFDVDAGILRWRSSDDAGAARSTWLSVDLTATTPSITLSGSLNLSSATSVSRSSASAVALQTFVTGDGTARGALRSDGGLEAGTGATTRNLSILPDPANSQWTTTNKILASGGLGTKHEAAATPTGGTSGEIRVGNGKVWVNDAGTWKSAVVA